MDHSTRTLRLSVVIPTLNEAAHLPVLLEALARESVPGEVLVCDGGSRDGTPELARAHGASVLGAARGRGPQLDAGLRAARGELVLFLHADTRPAPGALAAVLAAFEDARVVACGMHQRIEHPARFYRLVERAADRRVRRGWVYGDSGLCARRAELLALGGVPHLAAFEDLELSRRLQRRGRIVLVAAAELAISPRRWERDGRLRRTLVNRCLAGLYHLGVPPALLARAYRPMG